MTNWIRRYAPASDAPVRLVCLPHAGGAASFFRPLARALVPAVEVLAVQYPGRQDRRQEPPFGEIAPLADRVAEALTPYGDRPLALFGHSMGAVVGYEVALRLEAAGRAPVGLFASGRRAPSCYRDEAVHRLDDRGLVEQIRRLDGTHAEILDDPELLATVMTARRADYRAIETYRADPGRRLRCPVTVLAGTDDATTTPAEAQAWAGHTTGPFELRRFTGGHFFLVPRAAEVIELLRTRLGTASPHREPRRIVMTEPSPTMPPTPAAPSHTAPSRAPQPLPAASPGRAGRVLRAVLEGGPADLPEGTRLHLVAPAQDKIKVRHLGGYEHFERARDPGEDAEVVTYRWIARTKVAE